MCVIIHRQPNVEIPFDKLTSACLVNGDGWGVAIPDRGKLELRRVFESKGNDPDKIARILEDAKGQDVFLHLRFKTKGATDLKNVHPFTVTNKKTDGIDVQFMHNGTLSDFGNQADCDSKVFAREIVRPLYQALRSELGNNALRSPLFSKIMHKYAGPSSLFAVVDSLGNNLIVNKDRGVQFDGWWASNQYSFNSSHRDPPKTYNNYYYSSARSLQKTETTAGTSAAQSFVGRSDTVVKEDTTAPFGPTTPSLRSDIPNVTGNQAARYIIPKGNLSYPAKRQTFCDVAEIASIEECTLMSQENVKELVETYPEHAVLLIMDLLTELYDTKFDDDVDQIDSYYRDVEAKGLKVSA